MLNARCVEEEWRPGIAKGYVLFRAPKLVRSQFLKLLIESTVIYCITDIQFQGWKTPFYPLTHICQPPVVPASVADPHRSEESNPDP
jgi:hypothetical protein